MIDVLRILEKDARTPPATIADMTGRSEHEVREIIEKCEREGIIRTYKTVIDWDRVQEERVFAFIDVQVTPTRDVGFDDVALRIHRFPEVHSLYLVSGEYDLRIVVEGRSLKEVAFFVSEKLATIDRVRATATHFLLKKYKEDGVAFTEIPPDERLAVTP
ncbi:MAG: Lrp/AsnC family transcriptional regulator [Armatimonadota bacterium]